MDLVTIRGSRRSRGSKTRGDELSFKARDNKKDAKRGRKKRSRKGDHNGLRFEMLKLLMLSSKSSVARA